MQCIEVIAMGLEIGLQAIASWFPSIASSDITPSAKMGPLTTALPLVPLASRGQ